MSVLYAKMANDKKKYQKYTLQCQTSIKRSTFGTKKKRFFKTDDFIIEVKF